jgi:hypothetical protein
VPVRFASADRHRTPDHWVRVGPRSSPISGRSRLAANPADAILGEADLQWRLVWVKVNDNELLHIATQLLAADMAIPPEPSAVTVYAGGVATAEAKPGQIYTRYTRGDRMVIVTLQAVSANNEVSMTSNVVLAIAGAIMDALDAAG